MDRLETKEKIEIDFWRDSPEERPDADSLWTVVTKFAEAKVLLAKLNHFQAEFARAHTLLELGGAGLGLLHRKATISGC